MVCSAQKVKVAVKSAKVGASSHVTNSILKNAAKWLVYASTVTYLCSRAEQNETCREKKRSHCGASSTYRSSCCSFVVDVFVSGIANNTL